VDEPALRRLGAAFVRVAETIAYAHSRGVVHRDLKPDNVMIGAFGEVLVLDWGLAHVTSSPIAEPVRVSPEILERRGAVSGTPAYMPPEQAWGAPAEPPADVYALGAMLYALLTGRAPFDDTAMVVVNRLRAGERPPAPSGPDELVAACLDAMAPSPADRPSALKLARRVQAWLDGSQRRERARALVVEAEAGFAAAAALRQEAQTAQAQAETALRGVPANASADEKRAGWSLDARAEAARREAALSEVAAVETLHAALSHAPLEEARDRLAEYYRSLHARAEEEGDAATADSTLLRLRTYAGPGLRRYLDGAGALTLLTDPPGARATLHPFVERDRRLELGEGRELGVTPLLETPIPMGSWLVRLEAPGRLPVRYPVWARRNEHVDGRGPEGAAPVPVHLPHPDEAPPGAVYVPPGWFWAGARQTVFPWERPIVRAWTGAFWIAEHPVTQREYLAFLNDLLVRGHEDEARARSGHGAAVAGQSLGEGMYGRDADGRFVLTPDAHGDLWGLDWPVFLVALEDAEAYAAWAAERDGRAWRLPDEHEREHAARGADRRTYPWGDTFDATFCRTRENCGEKLLPADVGRPPGDLSVYGVHGLAGNVMDWCAEPGSGTGHAVPVPPDGHRVCRGGGFDFAGRAGATSSRWLRGVVHDRRWDGGFRLALTAAPAPHLDFTTTTESP